MLDKLIYTNRLSLFEADAIQAVESIENYEALDLIDKASGLIGEYCSYYINNFDSLSAQPRHSANATLAAFIKKADPSLSVRQEPSFIFDDKTITFDLVVEGGGESVAVETRDPRPIGNNFFESEVAVKQLAIMLRKTPIRDGVIFYYPGDASQCTVTTTASTSWPKDCGFREVYGADPAEVPNFDDEKFYGG